MEQNESNPLKPQPTGGLKLMTVFIAVLALHVVVIGGFSIWHLLYQPASDADLAVDKTHKSKIVSDSSLGDLPATDTASTDKTATPASTTDSAVSAASTTDTTATPTATSTAEVTPSPTDTPASGTTVVNVPTAPTPLTTPSTPTMADDDASSAAANPPVATPAPVHVATHPTVMTPDSTLAPPSDTTASTTPAAEEPATTPVVANGVPYTVKKGDSLARVARRHHITLAELRSANSLTSDRLHIAQVLVIPNRASKTPAVATTTKPAATTTAPAESEATDAMPAATTPTPEKHSIASAVLPKHTHKLAAATPKHVYTVVKGDTLTKIAKRYHTTTSALVAANGLANAARLSIGQKLHIPHEHSAATSTAEDSRPIDAEPHGSTRAQLANNLP